MVDFADGDWVRLKSGGPVMKVMDSQNRSEDGNEISTFWFVGNQKHCARFLVTDLVMSVPRRATLRLRD
ncbi:DUF2158 domain-containing protein [Sphingomonas crocodyli]|uniref:DUF2158 domain-containing protein n=1 Tax=Sphingomonas crocodyli TaxID=1979270 RepID=A0A437LXV4_9SPHN|nr:DUF2158 domain-containing protein [Sphingomonas crocodyli]